MSLPDSVQVLVVGAGPAGLVSAIALAKLGVQVVVVDASPTNPYGSRAGVVHSRTLEVLDTFDLAKPIIESGMRCEQITIRGTTNLLMAYNPARELYGKTEFPFSILIPQHDIEEILRENLATSGITLLRNKKVVGFHEREGPFPIEVTFEDGSVTRTEYLVGADGSRSTVRHLAGIEFKDPYTGVDYNDTTVPPTMQVALADVRLEGSLPELISKNHVSFYLDSFLALIPFKGDNNIPGERWRMVIGTTDGTQPPHNPSLEYLQKEMDERSPWNTRIKIKSVEQSSRYRVRTAAAKTYFKKAGQGNILLVGDAAHVHSPAGGQGMNLGICDAGAVAHAIHSHITTKDQNPEQRDAVLQRYADSRRVIGVRVMRMASGLTTLINASKGWRKILRNMALWMVVNLPWVRRAAAWRISGLINRDE